MMDLATLPVELPRSALTAPERTALEGLLVRARREADCPVCRGYGWHARQGSPAVGETHAAQVLVCACPAGERFWSLALDDTSGLLQCMDLDESGRIASVDGLYGRFGVNDRRLLRALAADSSSGGPHAEQTRGAGRRPEGQR